MRAFIQRRLTYANVMATMAVFIALGGSAVAASYVITKSSQIKNGAVTGADVRNSSLTGTDIKNKSLTAADFNGSVQGPTGQTGQTGPTGQAGQTGPAGPAGPAGPVSLQYVTGASVALAAGGSVTGTVACPSGMSVTGGGATILTVGPDVIMDSSYPSDDASDADSIRDNAWSVAYNNPTASASSFRVYAICTTPNSKS